MSNINVGAIFQQHLSVIEMSLLTVVKYFIVIWIKIMLEA